MGQEVYLRIAKRWKGQLEISVRSCDPRAMPPMPSSAPKDSTTSKSSTEPSEPRSGEDVLQGDIDVVTYHAEDSGYTVLKVMPEKGYGDPEDLIPGRVSAVGGMIDPAEGMRLRLFGEWTSHRMHGRQFKFTRTEVLTPADKRGLVKYLSSKGFKGVGETLAERIVDKLGLTALDIIRDTPQKLDGIKGLSGAVREDLIESVQTAFLTHKLRAFLTSLELNLWQIEAVAKKYGPDCEGQLRANPYLLSTGIVGIAFRTADRAARSLGLAPNAPARIEAALVYLLGKAASNGHTMLPESQLFAAARELLGEVAQNGPLSDALALLITRREVISEEDLREGVTLIYLPMYETCERLLAANLGSLCSSKASALATEAGLAAVEAHADIVLHPDQRAAILGMLSVPLGVLTGGPGVGKTTVLKMVVELAKNAGQNVILCSPTGRAAKRMAEATGYEAATVHRTLRYDPMEQNFAHNDEKPLEAGLIIVDEVSMLDIIIAHALVKAIAPPTRLLFVGDPDQLPSVAAGNVLADLLRSKCIPTWRLTQIFRQSETSRIVSNAHRILAGEFPVLPRAGEPKSDFYFFPVEGESESAQRLVDVVTERIPKTFGLDWTRDVQVLAPMYKGECGVDNINELLREQLPKRGYELNFRDRTWREGDRVIHTKNDYDREVFNGDMGFVKSVYSDGSGLVVDYPEQELFYEPEQLGDLRPAFAITVHRSQGSEYPCVVIPLVMRHYLMLQRHLFYTAITRAKALVVLVGSERALEMAIGNASQSHRESGLSDRLQSILDSID